MTSSGGHVRRSAGPAPGRSWNSSIAGRAAERHHAGTRRCRRGRRGEIGELGVGVAEQRVAALDEPRPSSSWHAEQAGRASASAAAWRCASTKSNSTSRRQRLVDHASGRAARMRLLVAVDLAAAERLGHEPAVAGCARAGRLHHRAPGRDLLGVHLLEADALRRRGERLDVAADAQQVGVAGDRPEPGAAVVSSVPPADRVVARSRSKVACGTPRVYVSGSAMSASSGP